MDSSPSPTPLKGLKGDRHRSRSRLDDIKRPPPSFTRSHPPLANKAALGYSSSPPGVDRDARKRSDGGREFWRKGYGGSAADRESLDGFDESGDSVERSRNSPRNTQGYERADRHHAVKPFPSERSDCARMPFRRILEHDRESFDEAEATRAPARRFNPGDCRQETAEGSNNFSSQEERASRKVSGFDKDTPGRGNAARDVAGKVSSVFERDGQEGNDPLRSPSWQGAGGIKDTLKISPRTVRVQDRDIGVWEPGKGSPMKDFGPEEGTKTPKTSPRKSLDAEKDGTEMHKNSAFRINREPTETEDMCNRASPKSKGLHYTEEEKSFSKAHKSSSFEGYARVRNSSNNSSKSHGWKQDVLEERMPTAIEGHDEGLVKKIPDASHAFPQIGKRGGPERERWRREEPTRSQSSKDAHPKEDKQVPEEAGRNACLMEIPASDVPVQEEDSVNASSLNYYTGADETDEVTQVSSENKDAMVAESDDRKLDKVEDADLRDSYSHRGKSEMEEGELEPEEEPLEEEGRELETFEFDEQFGTDTEMEKQGKGDDSEDHQDVSKIKPARERILVEGAKEGNGPNGCGNGSRENPQIFTLICDDINSREMRDMNKEQGPGTDKEGDKDLELQSMTTKASAAKGLDVGGCSKGELTLDILHEATPQQEMHKIQGSLEMKSHDSSGGLMLSLFMTPNGGEAADSKQKEHMTAIHSKSKEGFESPEQSQKLENSEVRMGKKGLADHREELGELSVYGHNHKKMKLESLQLSLALPGTNPSMDKCLAGFVEPERSFQSLTHSRNQTQNLSQTQTRTNSDGFTTSLSFSQSHSFVHNPSCSLNCTSVENQELSCGGSRQTSQGTEWMSHRSWQTPSGNDQMSNGAHSVMSLSQDRLKHRREVSLYQRMLQNGNMHSYQGFPSVTGSNRISGSNQISQRSHLTGQRFQGASKMPDVSSQDLRGSVRQSSVRKDFRDRLCQQEAWLTSNQHGGCQETQSEPHVQLERGKTGDHPESPAKGFRSEDVVGGRNLLNEKIGLREIATEPVAVMAQKLQELPDSFLESLKDLAKVMLGSFEKREEFVTLQDTIESRVDLTEDTLLRAHRTQLEILVTLKTGIQAFVQEGAKPLTYKALIEIFLRTRCQNINCQQSLPVYGCECRICSQKSGFCQECMCVVCCKFDSENHTCRWVGCDHCMHWCHTDCGLRMSYIMPAPSIQGGAGTSEIQYQCVACDHRSELFGFVKEVFEKCANAWSAETLAKELDCVRRIFHGSNDMRGKQLCWKAEQMLQKLENKVDAAEVRRSMLRFFNEGNAELDGARSGASNLAHPSKPNGISDRLADAGNVVADLDKARAARQIYSRQCEEKQSEKAEQQNDRAHNKANSEGLECVASRKQAEAKMCPIRADEAHQNASGLQHIVAAKHETTETTEQQGDRARKKGNIESLESIVWMKQVEAKMFQMRADEARQDATGLQHIVAVKREKIEDEYACKYANLKLHEAEERRRKRFEELHALEMAQHDYLNMKVRMKADIKDLLIKMEMTKRQFV